MHKCLCRMWLYVWFPQFLIFPNVFQLIRPFSKISLFSTRSFFLNPGWFSQISNFFQNSRWFFILPFYWISDFQLYSDPACKYSKFQILLMSSKTSFPVYLPNFIQNFCHPIICFSLKSVGFKILFPIMLNIPCGSAEGIGIVVWSRRDQGPRYFNTLVTDSEWEMDSIKSVKEGAQTIKEEIDPAIYRLFKRMMIEILSEQAEANLGKVPVKEEAPITIPMNIIGDHNRATSSKPSNNKNRGSQSSKLEESKDLKGKYSRIQNRPFQSSPQQKEKIKENQSAETGAAIEISLL